MINIQSIIPLTAKKGPCESRAFRRYSAFGEEGNVWEGATGPAEGVTEYGQENHWRDHTLEGEEVLDFGVRNAEEGKLKQEVEHKATHSGGGNALAGWYVVGDVLKAWPYSRKQDRHTLTARGGLYTAYRYN